MSPTLGYLLRLAVWALGAAAVLGPVVWASWRLLGGAVGDATRTYRLALLHLAALVALPPAVALGVHAVFAGDGAVLTRTPPRIPVLPPVEALVGTPTTWALPLVHVAGVVLVLACLGAAWLRTGRLRGHAAPRAVRAEVMAIRQALGLHRPLAVRVAGVSSPQVSGAWKPRLLLPSGFGSLPDGERRALLLHELAHVARSDFARNLLLRGLIALLWWQPAARPLYRAYAQAREELCDAWAVAHGACPAALARALVRLSERCPADRATVGMAAGSHLGHRVHRLLGESAPDAPSRPAAVMLSVALAAGLVVAGTWAAMQDAVLEDLYVASAFGPVVAIQARDPGGRFSLEVHRGRVLGATLDGHVLASSAIEQRGERVRIADALSGPLDMRVTAYGRIEWDARPAASMPIDKVRY